MHRAYKSVRAPDGDEFYDRLGQTVNENRGFSLSALLGRA